MNLVFCALVWLAMGTLAMASEPTLKGSREAVLRAYQKANEQDFDRLNSGEAIERYVKKGHRVPVVETKFFKLHDVSYPVSLPSTKLFIERLARQYYTACGEKLVVTSLMRPIDEQPRNASKFSVHPAGMAVDLRIPKSSACREWLRETLLYLEGADVLDVTREKNPAHYHVVVFPEEYQTYVAQRLQQPSEETTSTFMGSLWRLLSGWTVKLRTAIQHLLYRRFFMSAAGSP